jgi:serine/threonine-protein kinase
VAREWAARGVNAFYDHVMSSLPSTNRLRILDERPRQPPGWTTNRYFVLEHLGVGGMGEVVTAWDEQINRNVAIKRMRARHPSATDVERFLREAQIQGRLDHPAIVPVHEVGRDRDGLPFFVMKKLAGTTLEALLVGDDRERFGRARLLSAFVDVCLAVEFAHVRGVIHRDLKPANIVLGEFGETYVLDWGLAKVLDEADDTFDDVRDCDDGTVVGTEGFMAPEQTTPGADIGRPADVYALGRVLEDILHGTTAAPELELACRIAMDPDPKRRSTARALADRVRSYLDGDRDLERRRALAGEHLAAAHDALATEQRAAAMTHAGRALALDPESASAAGIVTTLMVEAPRELPAEVIARLADEDRRTGTQRSRSATFALLAVLGLAMLLPWLSVRSWTTFALAFGSVAASAALVWRVHVRGRPSTIVSLLVAAVLVLAFTRVAGPFMLTPTVIAGSLLAITANPRITGRPWWLIAWLPVVAFAPIGLEMIGVFRSTWGVSDGGFYATSAIFDVGGAASGVAIAVVNFVLLAAAGWYGLYVNRLAGDARRQLHLQAWQLSQLLPRAT